MCVDWWGGSFIVISCFRSSFIVAVPDLSAANFSLKRCLGQHSEILFPPGEMVGFIVV